MAASSELKSIPVNGGDAVSLCHTSNNIGWLDSSGERVLCLEESGLKSVGISSGTKDDLAPPGARWLLDQSARQLAWLDQAQNVVRVMNTDATDARQWPWGARNLARIESFTLDGEALVVYGADGWSLLSVRDGSWKALAATPQGSGRGLKVHTARHALLIEDGTGAGGLDNRRVRVPLGALPLNGEPFVALGELPELFWDDSLSWSDPLAFRNDRQAAVFPAADRGWTLLDLATLTTTQLTAADTQYEEGTTGQFSPDGELLLLPDCRSRNGAGALVCDTVVVGRDGDTVARVSGARGDERMFGPDAKHFLVLHQDGHFVLGTRTGETRSGAFGSVAVDIVWVDGQRMLYDQPDGVHVLTLAD
jgi:hypothetical protein